MKRIYGYLTVAFAAIMALASCDNAEYSIIDNGVYISEAALTDRFTQQVENQVVAGVVTKSLTIRLAKPVDTDVKVKMGIDQDFIDRYNASNGTVYQMLPDQYYSLDPEVTIPAGSISATANLVINPYDTPNGEAYALAVKIADVEGPVEAVSDATHLLYLLMAPHRQQVALLSSSNANGAGVTFKTPFELSTWTFEFWMRCDNYNGHSRQPYGWQGGYNDNVFYDNSSPITVGPCYLRWWADGALHIGPCFQNQMDIYFDDNTEAWKAGVWYHIAYTYDGTTIQLYIDGEKNAFKDDPNRTRTFDRITLVQNFVYNQNVAFAQIRLWDNNLPQSSIQDAMNRGVPNDSPGLIGYWKCDEGEGNILNDSTVNENHITLYSNADWNTLGTINFMTPNAK